MLLPSDASAAAEAAIACRARARPSRCVVAVRSPSSATPWRAISGRSFYFREPALEVILERLPATLELAGSVAMAARGRASGVPLGALGGLRTRGASSTASVVTGSILGFSLPTFMRPGSLLIMLFSVTLRWLPAGGAGRASPRCSA